MIINEYILYIVLIKRGKIQLVGENKKKWYGGRLHLIHDAPPLLGSLLLYRYPNLNVGYLKSLGSDKPHPRYLKILSIT